MRILRKQTGGKVRKVWEIKKKVLKGKKTDIEATAIINPKTGNLALSKGEKMAIILPTGQWYAPSAVITDAWYCMVLHCIA